MPKRTTRNEFITKAKKIHGEKYGYDDVVYVNKDTKVKILCKIHGIFYQSPHSHLNGSGCPICGLKKNVESRKGRAVQSKKRLLFYECYNDCNESIVGEVRNAYNHWRNMLVRCYNKEYHKWKPSYHKCSVCEQWKLFSNFLTWFRDKENGYKDGYCLDKDILIKGNKKYSPDTCCFVPSFINTLLLGVKSARGKLPIGVKLYRGKYCSTISVHGKLKYLGIYNTKEEAFLVYKNAREAYIKKCAREYYEKKLITKKVFDALMNYNVEITD